MKGILFVVAALVAVACMVGSASAANVLDDQEASDIGIFGVRRVAPQAVILGQRQAVVVQRQRVFVPRQRIVVQPQALFVPQTIGAPYVVQPQAVIVPQQQLLLVR
mgnify:FL=1